MLVKSDLPPLKEKILKYFNRKEVWSYEFIRYNIFKKIISHITKISNNYDLRKIFLYLLDQDLFLKKKTKVRSYLYKFKNPNKPKITTKSTTITFD
mgnify:FL=1